MRCLEAGRTVDAGAPEPVVGPASQKTPPAGNQVPTDCVADLVLAALPSAIPCARLLVDWVVRSWQLDRACAQTTRHLVDELVAHTVSTTYRTLVSQSRQRCWQRPTGVTNSLVPDSGWCGARCLPSLPIPNRRSSFLGCRVAAFASVQKDSLPS